MNFRPISKFVRKNLTESAIGVLVSVVLLSILGVFARNKYLKQRNASKVTSYLLIGAAGESHVPEERSREMSVVAHAYADDSTASSDMPPPLELATPKPVPDLPDSGEDEQGEGEEEKKVKEALESYRKLVSIYHHPVYDFRPPEWVLENSAQILRKFGKFSFVLYTNGSREEAVRLATQREPVNIKMQRYYDEEALEREFKYERGAYGDLSDNGTKLPPQIAVACVTPVLYEGETRVVAVVNLVGMAFDQKEQPDYKVLITNQPNGELDKQRLKELMVNTYKMAFKAAEIMERGTLCCSPIGDMAFRPKQFYETQESFLDEVIKPAVAKAKESFPEIDMIWAQYPDFDVPSAFKGPWAEDRTIGSSSTRGIAGACSGTGTALTTLRTGLHASSASSSRPTSNPHTSGFLS